MSDIKKFLYFPLWKIENLEHMLEDLEQNGYRLTNVNCSHWFTFKEASPKQVCYFLSYKSFRGESMAHCDYALESKHKANLIDSKMCYYSLYRTKEQKESLSLLYEVRMDYIRKILLNNALTSLLFTLVFAILFFLCINVSKQYKLSFIIIVIIGICVCLTAYYFFGYFKQRSKCKKYGHDHNSNH